MPPQVPTVQSLMTMDDLRLAALVRRLAAPSHPSDMDWIKAHEFTEVLDFLWQEGAFLASLPIGAVNTVVTEYVVQAGQLGVLRWIGMALQNFTDFDNVVWRLVVNGMPVTGFDYIQGQIGSILFPTQIRVPLPRASRVQVLASNIGVAAVPIVEALIGGTTFQGPEAQGPEGT